jgi:hypothetical protein
MFRKLDLFPSSGERGSSTLLGPLERVNLGHWFTHDSVASRSKAWTSFVPSNAGIVYSNPAQGVDVFIVCVHSVFVLFCV